MASFGQSISQAKQYQHSSKAMCALLVSGFTAKQSTGHESMQMRQPVMHFARSTTTGTSKRRTVCAFPTCAACAAFTVSRSLSSLMVRLSRRKGGLLLDAQAVIATQLRLIQGHHVRGYRALEHVHQPLLVLFQVDVHEPILVVELREVLTVMIKAPATL